MTRPARADTERREVGIPADGASLAGTLTLPAEPLGVVAFAHGSGSSRHSPRNRFVADVLHRSSVGTLLFDLLTPEEDTDYQTRFDIGLLTLRLLSATEWLAREPTTAQLPLGYFGASTGAAAALAAAAARSRDVAAIVSRGGRPDLAGARALESVSAPTLLIIGGNDPIVIDLNREAAARLRCDHAVQIVPGATHLFEEPGALEEVARMAAAWFVRWFARPAAN